MKKLICMSILLVAGSIVAKAGDPVSVTPFPNSRYDIAHSTIAVSSNTVTTIAAVGGYRAAYIGQLGLAVGATIFYRIDGSTAAIPTVGSWILPGEEEKIETDNAIHLQLGVNQSSITARLRQIRK
jgi:hypothetical protein